MRKLIFGRKYNTKIDLNNSLFINNVAKAVTMNGMVTRTIDHKGGNTAIQFGSGNLASVDNLPASPVWSIAFWIKTTQLTVGILAESSENFNNNRPGFLVDINEYTQNKMIASMSVSGAYKFYKVKSPLGTNINGGDWQHIVIIFNRNSTGDNEIKIFKNKEQLVLSTVSYNAEMSGDFLSRKIFIGGRGASYQHPFVGATSPFKLFNYPLTQTEIDNLYNE